VAALSARRNNRHTGHGFLSTLSLNGHGAWEGVVKARMHNVFEPRLLFDARYMIPYSTVVKKHFTGIHR
jgi:hypothetical protein